VFIADEERSVRSDVPAVTGRRGTIIVQPKTRGPDAQQALASDRAELVLTNVIHAASCRTPTRHVRIAVIHVTT